MDSVKSLLRSLVEGINLHFRLHFSSTESSNWISIGTNTMRFTSWIKMLMQSQLRQFQFWFASAPCPCRQQFKTHQMWGRSMSFHLAAQLRPFNKKLCCTHSFHTIYELKALTKKHGKQCSSVNSHQRSEQQLVWEQCILSLQSCSMDLLTAFGWPENQPCLCGECWRGDPWMTVNPLLLLPKTMADLLSFFKQWVWIQRVWYSENILKRNWFYS